MTDLADRLRAGLADRYRIERELGRGGMATVYLAEDLKHHRLVALKVLRPELTATLGPERFLREIDVASHLQHPHILPLFDSGQLGDGSGIFYYVMPFVEGESLRARIERERQLPLGDAIRLAIEVADALSAAHAQGVIHRDIKPENILLTGAPHDESGSGGQHAVVADFGIARAVSAAGGEKLTETGMALGTPQYMSPEQATASGLDARADIYSLGCVLYEMLTGGPPFTGATAQAVLARHSVDPVPHVRTVRNAVPDAVERVVLRALAKVPADRYASAREFAKALAQAASTRDIVPLVPLRIWRRSAVLVGLALIGAGGMWWSTARLGRGWNDSGLSPEVAGQHRVAILPFANVSPDTADAYLARGISEEIASRLGDFPELRVASRSSVDRLERVSNGDLAAHARTLGFGYLVEGSVRRASARVRVSVRLVDAADGVRRWNQSYDRATTDLLALQDEIAQDVARAVAGHVISGAVPRRTATAPSPAAHDQLLRGNYYLEQRNPRALARALEAYAEASRLDSGFALAFAKLAHAHTLFLDWGWTYDELSPEGLFARGWEAAERAIHMDPKLSDGWLARGSLLRFGNPKTLAGVRDAVQRAVDLDPANAEAHHEFGMILRLLDEDSAAAKQFEQGLKIDPDRPMSLIHLGWIALIDRQYGQARRWLDSAAAVNPGFFQAYAERAALRLLTGDTAGARADAQTTVRLRPKSDPLAAEDVLIALDMRSGDTAAARARLARLRPLRPGPHDPGVHQASAWAALLVAAGRTQEAITFLEQARVAPTHLRFHLKEPRFDPLRGNPRFDRLMERFRAREKPAA
jgi:serine/threonine protein kinase/Tfp pilus assembly protein PilF